MNKLSISVAQLRLEPASRAATYFNTAVFLICIFGVFPSCIYAGNSKSCIADTSGSCGAFSDCDAWRGTTRCKGGHCFCADGTCSGADGVCGRDPYVMIGNGTYRIKNSRWPEYYMEASQTATSPISVGELDSGESKDFSVVELPFSRGPESLAGPAILISSARSPDNVVAFKQAKGRQYLRLKDVQGEATAIDQVGVMLTLAPEASVNGDTPVMLSLVRYPNKYAFIPSWSSSLELKNGDPGAGGYWYFEPRLPEDLRERLPTYEGSRCEGCGIVRNVAGAWRYGAPVSLLAALWCCLHL